MSAFGDLGARMDEAQRLIDQQTARHKRLAELVDTHHRGKFGDYSDTYEEFANTYLRHREVTERLEEARAAFAAMGGRGVELAEEIDKLEVQLATLPDPTPIPRFAAVREDETYGMVEVYDTLPDAIAAEGASVGEEYLMNPAGVFDLDTGERIPTVSVTMSAEAYTVLCGLVQPDWMHAEGEQDEAKAVNHAGIYSEAWDELRSAFPLEHFRTVAAERGEDFYHEEAGL